MKSINHLTLEEINRIIQMAWEDRTSFDAIKRQFDISEAGVIALMRREMKASSFKMWRKRVQNRSTKHDAKRDNSLLRFRSRHKR